ncbi:MAG: hypothetical protein IPK04_17715 [Bdellovibrionales bacterium]|nr:hypothetical protein [Bdellovibrionales bacterium]
MTLVWLAISRVVAAEELTPKTDPFDLPQVVAVENKKFNPLRDITLQIGILPLDAFYKALTGGVTYTHSFQVLSVLGGH